VNASNTGDTSGTDWDRLARMTDEDIDYSDIPELDAAFWAEAEVVTPKQKVPVTLRLDEDIVEAFKRDGKGYQTRINSVLRAYVDRVLRRNDGTDTR